MSERMNTENESESSIPFIDDDEPEKEERNHSQCNLKITRNYQKKTRRVEMTRILQDSEPMNNRSLSPVAPLARDSENLTSDVSDSEAQQQAETPSAAEFELTIKSNNSVIKIQGFDGKPTITLNAGKATGDMYELLRKEVDKMFRKPEGEEVEEAKRSEPTKKRKENTWKLLTRSLINMRSGRAGRDFGRESDERYPKMVLLQEPKAIEESQPKTAGADTEKKADIENAKSALRMENENIEKSKTEISKEREYINEEKRMLKEKKETVEGKKSKLEDTKQRDERFLQKKMAIIEEEKLCVALEKQLLGEEKVMLNEEMELLSKEGEMLQKERTLLGEEKEDEKRKRQTEQERQEISRDIEDVFKRTLNLDPNIRQQEVQRGRTRQENGHHPLEHDDLIYSSVPPLYGQYGQYHCPTVYIPVYNRSIPYCPYNNAEFCCGGRSELSVTHKNSTTQTNMSTVSDAQLQTDLPEEEKDLDLPLGFLSSFFPRIVVMKSFQEEIRGEDADPKIVEISSPPGSNEKEDEARCDGFDHGGGFNSELNPETETRSEDQTTMENQCREEDEESLTVFSMEEQATEEGKTAEVAADTHDLTLTSIGFSIYDKLTELATERGKSTEEEKDVEAEDGRGRTGNEAEEPSCSAIESKNRATNLAMRDDGLNFQIRGAGKEWEAAMAERKFVTDGKVIVERNKLWHPSNGGITRGSGSPEGGGMIVSVYGSEGLVFTVQMRGEESKGKTKDAKVGTDGFEVAGELCASREAAQGRETSPRTGKILRRLKDRLEAGKRQKRDLPGGEYEFPGLFFIRPVDLGRGFPSDDYIMTKDRARRNRSKRGEGSPENIREYYCEECLATMRLFEDENPSVKNMIDKFETIIQLGSY